MLREVRAALQRDARRLCRQRRPRSRREGDGRGVGCEDCGHRDLQHDDQGVLAQGQRAPSPGARRGHAARGLEAELRHIQRVVGQRRAGAARRDVGPRRRNAGERLPAEPRHVLHRAEERQQGLPGERGGEGLGRRGRDGGPHGRGAPELHLRGLHSLRPHRSPPQAARAPEARANQGRAHLRQRHPLLRRAARCGQDLGRLGRDAEALHHAHERHDRLHR
mmetsp:Transcript_105070/g.303969  ORF Transcript_105070/g.303969 Transcript_105070/m.303969 type:complete len:221 (+) Transcript_105070:1414-2076(+)